jgi:endonuclease/exonuclease/phosphatase family metal-dependent hydrolase
MVAVRAALALLLTAGCALDVGPAQPWIPASEAQPPLAAELAAPGGAKTSVATLPAKLRVVTYNVDEEVAGMTPQQLADAILGDPDLAAGDVYLLQEEEHHPWEATSRAAQLAELLGLGYVYVPARMHDTSTHGLAILSSYPIANVEKMDLPHSRGRQRIAVAADIVVDARVLHVIDVHLDPFLDSSQRLAQLRPAVIDAPDAVLVGGDFNMSWVQWVDTGVPVLSATSATDQSVVVDAYMRALGFATPSAGSGMTAHASGYQARLDAFYSRGLDVSFGGVVRTGPSDHWPLWIDVTLPAAR